VRGDIGGEPLEALVQEVFDALGVARFGESRVADDVGEQDRDDTAFVPALDER
jgi:hypothetical protein